MILRLGSGKASRHPCGAKAALLDRAARAGLAVPAGVIVLDEAWRHALERGLVRVEGSGARRPVSVPDPSLLIHLIGLPDFAAPLAVRAAFSEEEGTKESPPGTYVPGLFVDGRRPAALAAGLAGVWAAAFKRPRGFRRDLIVQNMVLARHAGTAVTEQEHEDDLVEVTEATAETPDDGPVAPGTLLLPKRRRGEGPTEADPVTSRLQGLLRGVRRVFDEGGWVVEWADDGQRVWILQIRPLAEPVLRNELFTVAGHRDILPDPPSRSHDEPHRLVRQRVLRALPPLRPRPSPGPPARRGAPRPASPQPVPAHRDDAPLGPAHAPGEPTRSAGPPTGTSVCSRDARLRHARVLGRLARAQMRSVSSARLAEEQILDRTASPPMRLADTLEELRWLYATLVPEMLSLTAAMSGPLALLRRSGTLRRAGRRLAPHRDGDARGARSAAGPGRRPPRASRRAGARRAPR